MIDSPSSLDHPIVTASFEIIDREIGEHSLSVDEYAIVRRIIHSTADFEFKHLLSVSPGAIATGVQAIRQGCPLIVDVNMLRYGIQTMVTKTFRNPVYVAIDYAVAVPPPETGQDARSVNRSVTRSEWGMKQCLQQHPNGIFVVGNAPTALLAIGRAIAEGIATPALVIGAPVGFVSVLEAKAALAQLSIPQIRVEGRKGGSSVAAAIVNALLVLASDG